MSGLILPADPWPEGVAVGVFAKHWTPGETKTRLAATIGEDAAAACSRRFLETTLERVAPATPAAERLLAFAPNTAEQAFAALDGVREGAWRLVPQAAGDLGARMRSFFQRAAVRTTGAILLGSDTPHLPLNALQGAAAWLAEPAERPRLVLGPTTDGGYWLIGLRGEPPPIFDRMPWSQPGLLGATTQRLQEAGWREGADYRFTEPWYDIDEAADLDRIRSELVDGDATLLRLADRLDVLLGPR